jgi:hypothetical protein
MTTHDFGTTLPLGICSTCLARSDGVMEVRPAKIGGRFGDPTGTRWIRGDDCRAV